jgi:uncharacterized protein (DUF58 family)
MRLNSTMKAALAHLDGEAWLRFVMAILGLALAFVAALFSSIARNSGNGIATALFASTALLLAGMVGVVVVPHLARRAIASRVHDALDFEITREGVAYLGVVLVVAIAALNTTNNLLFIVLAAMLAAIVVSGFASAAMLRGLELDVASPEIAFAGKPLVTHIRLRNRRRVFPAFSVRVTSRINSKSEKKQGWEWQRSEFVFPRRSRWMRLPDYALRRKAQPPQLPPIFEHPVYFSFVPPETTLEAQVELTFSKRGRYSQDSFYLATRFPFSFLIRGRRVKLGRELVVYPTLLASDEFMQLFPQITGEQAAMVRGSGSELYRIREHTPQDPVRFVDWKAAAKTGSLKVREFAREDEHRLRIVFDNPAPRTVSPEAYEHGVSVAASLAWHLAAKGISLSFVAPSHDGVPGLYDFLLYLALVQPAAGESVLDTLPASDDYNIIITGRHRDSIPTSWSNSSYVIHLEDCLDRIGLTKLGN